MRNAPHIGLSDAAKAKGRISGIDDPLDARRRRWRRRTLLVLGIAGTVVAAIWIGAKTLVPPLLRRTAERLATQALGRELRIAGSFEVSFSLTPRITVANLRLANARWGSEPSMVEVGRATVVVRLSSLWSGPPVVRALEIENARVLLETDEAGTGNWVFASPRSSRIPHQERAKGPPVAFEWIEIRGLKVIFRSAPKAEVAALDVRDFHARLDGRNLEFALDSRVGESRLGVRGRIPEPLVLQQAELEVSAQGPDIIATLKTLGFESPLTGPFQLDARILPAKEGIGADLSATVGTVAAKARGVVSPSLDEFLFDVEARGPDASVVGSWIDVEGIPAESFTLSGQLRRRQGRFSLEGISARVGSTSLVVSGVLGKPPRFEGTDLVARGEGSDLADLSKLTTLALPGGRFEVTGRFLRRSDALAIDSVELRFRDTLIRAEGTIGEPPEVRKLDLKAELSGPDLALFSSLLATHLPHGSFALRGRVVRVDGGLDLQRVEGRFGDANVNARVRLLLAKKQFEGTGAQVHVTGPNLGHTASLLGLHGLPAEPFEASAQLGIVPGGYRLENVTGSIGRIFVAGDGDVGIRPFRGMSLRCRVRGPALSDLAEWGLPPNLPAEPFSVSGQLRIERGIYRASGVVAKLGSDRVELDGTLGALPDLSQLDVTVHAAGPSLVGLERFTRSVGFEAPARVPRAPYEIFGQVRRAHLGYELHDVLATVAQAEVRLDGLVGADQVLTGTDLRFRAAAPDTSLLAEIVGRPMPAGALEVHGRVTSAENGLLLEGVALSLGDLQVKAAGRLGAPPKFRETELHLDAFGPDASALLGAVGLSAAPVAPFQLSADVTGSLEKFVARRFAARLGGSDLKGSLTVHAEDKRVDAELESDRLDLPELVKELNARPAAPETPAPSKQADHRRLIPDYPLELSALRYFDGRLSLQVAELVTHGPMLRNVVFFAEVHDGGIRLDRVEGSGPAGAFAAGFIEAAPSDRGYRISTQGRLDDVRIEPSRGAKEPPFNAAFQLKGEGRSLHELFASFDGSIQVAVGHGRVGSSYAWMSAPITSALLNALNPFRKSESENEFECGIAVITFQRGRALVEPLAARTDKLTIIGKGSVDFDTENIDFNWTLKSRQGIGLPSVGSVVNPYVSLGGTLSSPQIQVKALDAAEATATLGLAIVFKGLYDRITAENNVCINSLVKVTPPDEAKLEHSGAERP